MAATLIGWAGCLSGPAVADDDSGNTYFALLAGASSGNFGTSSDTDLYSLTPELGHVSEFNAISVSVPFHHVSVSGGGVSTSETGVGDATFRGSRNLFRDERTGYSLSGTISLKLATGDESKGLGTGATDLGISLSGDRTVGVYTFTALVGYTQVGEPSGISYDNIVSYGIGFNRRFVRTNVFASLQGQTAATPDGTDPLAIDVGFFRILTLKDVAIVHALTGLSDGSPDFGIELGLVRWF